MATRYRITFEIIDSYNEDASYHLGGIIDGFDDLYCGTVRLDEDSVSVEEVGPEDDEDDSDEDDSDEEE
jgi:hypothetical protein